MYSDGQTDWMSTGDLLEELFKPENAGLHDALLKAEEAHSE